MFRTIKGNLKRAAQQVTLADALSYADSANNKRINRDSQFRARLAAGVSSGTFNPVTMRKPVYRSKATTARRIKALRKGMANLKRKRPSRSTKKPMSKKKTKLGRRQTKVSPAFKRKVLAATAAEECKGQFHFKFGSGIASTDNANITLFWDGHGAIDRNYCILGTPLQVLNVAAYLYNQKAWTEAWTTTSGNFPQDDFHVHVTSQREDMVLKNNTMREFRVTFYECVAKNDQTNAPLTDLDAILATDVWTAGDPRPNRAGTDLLSSTNNWETRTGAVAAGSNIRPEMIHQWNKLWKVSHKTYRMKPGASRSFSVKIGDQRYKTEDFTNGSGTIFRFMAHLTKTWFFRFEPEQSENIALNVGLQQFPTARPHFLLTRHQHVYMKQPEHTSDIAPAVAGGPIIASNKQDVYAFLHNYDLPTVETNLSRLDPKAPQVYTGYQQADAAVNPT